MASSLLNNLPIALAASDNAATDLFYAAIEPFNNVDDRKQTRANLFGQIPTPVGLGKPGTVQGSLLFYNANNSNAISFVADTPAASLIYTWPNASPTAGQVLSASAPSGSNVTLTWVAAGAPGGSTTQLQRNAAGAFGGISGATSDGTNVTFGSGNLRATSPQITTGIFDSDGNELLTFSPVGTAINQLDLANSTASNPVTLTTAGGDSSIGLTITCKGTGILTVTGNVLMNSIIGTTGVGVGSAVAEQFSVTSLSASRVAMAINSLANATVDLVQWTQNRSNTNTVANLATLTTNSSGTAAAGFGHQITHQLASNTTPGRVAAIEGCQWKVATDASRASIFWISTVSNAATSERFLIAPRRTLTDGAASTILTMTLASNSSAGCVVHATIHATDGAAYQSYTLSIYFAATNNAGSMSATAAIIGTPAENSPTGTLTATVGTTTGAGSASLQITADTSLTDPGIFILFSVDSNSEQAIAITV